MNKKLLCTLALCAFLLMACGQQQQNQPDATEPFVGGTIGLNPYFIEGAPPPEVQDNAQSPFSVAVVLENQGEADVGPGTDNPFVRVNLQGINPQKWGVNDSAFILDQALRGARKNIDGTILPGEITTATFEGLNYEDNIRGNTEFVLRAEMCYDYTTLSTTRICIKDNPLENIQDTSLCTLSGEKKPRNSGAPVHVTSVTQNPLGSDKIQVNFMIEHVGVGTFYGRQEGENCNPSNTNFNKHKLHVRVVNISDSGYSISCPRLGGTNQGMVKLYQGAPQQISCTVERTGPDQGRVFQEVMEVELRYRYGQFIETPILVQDVSNEPGGTVGSSGTQ
jgi:hypothetical protein